MTSKKTTPPSGAETRAQRLSRLQAEQTRKDRRWKIGITAAAAVPVLALVAAFAIPFAQQTQGRPPAAAATDVQTFTGLARDHVSTPVTYAQHPPVGGAHTAHWQNCGIYSEPIAPVEPAVHSLEHGAVWITYDPSLPSDQVGALRSLVRGKPYAMLSPMRDLPSPVVASAWGLQMQAADASDPRLPTFLNDHLQGPQTPERGAACFGGVGTPQ